MKCKQIMLSLLLSAASGLMYAQAQRAVVVDLANGERRTFLFADSPEATFVGESLEITSASASVTYQRSEIDNIHFDDVTAIAEVTANEMLISYHGDGVIHVSGVEAEGLNIKAYDMNGRACKATVNSIGTETQVSLEGNASGIYIVTIGDQTIKVRK